MSALPVLVAQTRRMGDLILSFPTLMDLRLKFPQSPLWVVARPEFFQGLLPFAPSATFFPPSHLGVLGAEKYEAVINLDSTPETAAFAARADAGLKLGVVASPNGLRVLGPWQLYRESLTLNNRHNSFHWADLNRLDLGFPLAPRFIARPRAKNTGVIGLFIGASDPLKRPDAEFWISLATRLAKMGFKPMLLGGPAEKEAGAHIARRARLEHADFCGKTPLPKFAAIIKTLDLFITPDTGPMHLADWLGAPVLNLSMGNVHALETGPASPGQLVCRAAMSCVGCWRCQRHRPACRAAFMPAAIARIARGIITEGGDFSGWPPGLEVLRVCRDERGLRHMQSQNRQNRAAIALENFWRSVFLWINGNISHELAMRETAALPENFPALCRHICGTFAGMLASFAKVCRGGSVLPADFWRGQPWHSRIFAGHAQMYLQNHDYARPAMLATLERIAAVREFFARCE